ncbi:hypothetical protein GCM10029963_75150 [Micromonospora andamanensis]
MGGERAILGKLPSGAYHLTDRGSFSSGSTPTRDDVSQSTTSTTGVVRRRHRLRWGRAAGRAVFGTVTGGRVANSVM